MADRLTAGRVLTVECPFVTGFIYTESASVWKFFLQSCFAYGLIQAMVLAIGCVLLTGCTMQTLPSEGDSASTAMLPAD